MGAMRSDAELLGDYAGRRDEAAFAELAARHGSMVYRVCLRILGDAHEAEDASQATFVVLARKAGSLTRKADLAAWLHWTARNAAHWQLRARLRRRRHEEEAAMVRAVESASAGADRGTGTARSSLGEHLDDELARLPEAERQAVVLRYLEDRSQEESAAVAGCPVGTLSRRASDGLARLRERLTRRDSALSTAALAGFLVGETQAAVPASLLPSLVAASKLTAAGAAAGASATATAIAEGVVKAMFWAKMKVAAAVFAAVAAVGVSTPVVLNAVAGDGPSPADGLRPTGVPQVAAKDDAIKAKVVKVEVLDGLPPVASVTISAGKAQGVRKGFVFQILRDDQLLNPPPNARELTVETVGETESVGSYPLASGLKIETPRVGDLATTRLAEVLADKPKIPEVQPAADGEAVNGLRLTLVAGPPKVDPARLPVGWRLIGQRLECPLKHPLGSVSFANPEAAPKCPECGQRYNNGKLCEPCSVKLARCATCGVQMPLTGCTLRWENVGKEPLVIFPMSPLGGQQEARRLLPGESHELCINRFVGRGTAGEYRLSAVFTQDKEKARVDFAEKGVGFHGGGSTGAGGKVGPLDPQAMKGASLWIGKVASSEVKLTADKAGITTSPKPEPPPEIF